MGELANWRKQNWVRVGTDGKIKYTSVDGDFNEVGTWRIQAKVVMGGGTFRSDVGTFRVYENL